MEMQDREARGKLHLRGTHDVAHVEEVYRPPNMLDIPEFDDSDQYVYRWLRVSLGGEEDAKNIMMRLREGWTFVKLDELKDASAFHVVDAQKGSSHLENTVRIADVALAKLPRAKAEAYYKYIDSLNDKQATPLTQSRLKTQVDGHDVYLDNESRAKITRGQVDFGD